ncbi:MAG: bifunctional 5,10-methylenetetrahydrofolate dehydrogenase/5,10-methenyltetrahydrofolate cyclohydrolase [Acidimicrobiales bacterium]
MYGNSVAHVLYERTRRRASDFTGDFGRPPCLAALVVGTDPASRSIVRLKQNRCRQVGIDARIIELAASITTEELVDTIRALSDDGGVDGIVVQDPIPSTIDQRAAFDAICPTKDVNGVTTASFAAAAYDRPAFRSCTPAAIMTLLNTYRVPLVGAHAVVVGADDALGPPLCMMLLTAGATVTCTDTRAQGAAELVATADVVITGTGVPGSIPGAWIRAGAVVLDAGTGHNGLGDVEFDTAIERASLLAPATSGVGPLAVALLLAQTMDAALPSDDDPADRDDLLNPRAPT